MKKLLLNSARKTNGFFLTIIKVLLVVGFFLVSSNTFGQAASIWTNPITGTNPGASNPYTTGDVKNANITVTGIGRGTSLSASNANNIYNTSGWSTAATIDLNGYFNFTITPIMGYKVSMNNFTYTTTSGSRPPASFAFRSDANSDNFTNGIGAPNVGGTTISLTASPYQNLNAATTFRLYGWNRANGGGGTWAINDFTFSGSVLGSATTALSFGVTNPYGSSPVQSFQVNGNGLSSANATVTINGSTNYEVSTTSSTTGFGATANLTATGGSLLGATVWVRIKATSAVGTYNENITFGGGGVTSLSIACSGTVTQRALTVTANNVSKCFGTTYALGTTAFTSIGLQNVETIGSVILTSSGASSEAAANVYSVVPTGATGGTFIASNYTIAYENGTFTVNALPNAPIGTDSSRCGSGTVNLLASVSGGETVDWYDTSSGGTLLLSGTSAYTTPSISSTTIYYAVAMNTTTGCVSSSRTAITATVNTLSTAPTGATGTTTICPGTATTLTVAGGIKGTSSVTQWYTGSCGETLVSTSDTLNTGNLNSDATYYVRYSGTCNNTICATITVTVNTTTWNGTTWSSGLPDATKAAVISGTFISPGTTTPYNLTACKLTVNSGASVLIKSGDSVTLDGALIAILGSFVTFNSGANLIQNGTTNTNTGAILIKRESAPLKRLDYTLWASPVASQQLQAFSPYTLSNRFYSYNTNTNLYEAVDPSATTFSPFNGYLIRAPNTHPTNPTTWTGQFAGVPNNGIYSATLTNFGEGKRYNLIGNPYPSAIDVDTFIDTNIANGSITGTVYFWRKTNGAINGAYCTYNLGGYTTNGDNGIANMPVNPVTNTNIVQVGQGFFVEGTGTNSVIFTNDMRINNGVNRFFRTSNTIERNRIWLNITNATGSFSQAMIGYMTGATQGVDPSIDGELLSDGDVSLASLIGTTSYAIQGRALPFDMTDVVPMSFKVTTAGDYTITIDHVDGLFSNGAQTVCLRDNVTGVVHNLSAGGYTFTSASGTFDARFEIIYQATSLTVSTPTFNESQVVIYKTPINEISINTGNVVMSKVKVFDIRGRFLQEQKDINATQTTINVGLVNEVLLVQISSEDGVVVTKKVVR
jgi:hypothetical protein